MLKNKGAIAFLIFTAWAGYIFAQSQFVYNDQGKRDPFIPLVTADGRLVELVSEAAKTTVLSVEGIMYDNHGVSYTLVNGEVLKTGEEINGYQVLKIEKNKVVFIKEGETIQVELKKEGE